MDRPGFLRLPRSGIERPRPCVARPQITGKDARRDRQELAQFLGACRTFLALTAHQAGWSTLSPPVRRDAVILSAIAEKLKRRSKDDLSGRGAGYPAPPFQIPGCGFPVPGSVGGRT